jgi:hypothetical protein
MPKGAAHAQYKLNDVNKHFCIIINNVSPKPTYTKTLTCVLCSFFNLDVNRAAKIAQSVQQWANVQVAKKSVLNSQKRQEISSSPQHPYWH